MRIAIIEDHESVAKGIAYRLHDRGHTTDILSDGAAADVFLRSDDNEIIILDISLPGMDGLSLLKALRARGDARPVLLLTARTETHHRVAGLDAGADDYLAKPFEMDELEARLRALARRGSQALREVIAFGPLTFDLGSRTARAGEALLDLPRRELGLLETLMGAQGRTIAKSALIEALYGTGADIEESAIEAHVSRLRKRLRPFDVEIVAKRGLGYALRDAA